MQPRFYYNPSHDPAFNLALEEWFMTHNEGDFTLLWRNSPTVVIGRNQNARAEIDFGRLKEQGISLVRRSSGGGAVYHDLGNINFSFITDKREDMPDAARLCAPVIDFLRSLSLSAECSGRNDMTTGGAKFSGSARCCLDGRFLFHGTLLFDADLSVMAGVLTPDAKKLASKGISSVRARVTNLRPLLREPLTPDEFLTRLCARLSRDCGTVGPLRADQLEEIELVAQRRYRNESWTFGKNPAGEFVKAQRFPFGSLSVSSLAGKSPEKLSVIDKISIFGDFFGELPIELLESALQGTEYTPAAVLDAINRLPAPLSSYIEGCTPDDFLLTLF